MWKAERDSEWLVYAGDPFWRPAAQIFGEWLNLKLWHPTRPQPYVEKWVIPDGTIPYRDIPRNAAEHLIDVGTTTDEMWTGMTLDPDTRMPLGREQENQLIFADNFIRNLTDRVELSREDLVCLVGRAPGWARIVAAGILARSQFRSIAYAEKGRRVTVYR